MNTKSNTETPTADIFAAILIGIGLSMGVIPIALASLLVKENLLLVIWDRMDGYWRERGWS
jgi:hypothetical protein